MVAVGCLSVTNISHCQAPFHNNTLWMIYFYRVQCYCCIAFIFAEVYGQYQLVEPTLCDIYFFPVLYGLLGTNTFHSVSKPYLVSRLHSLMCTKASWPEVWSSVLQQSGKVFMLTSVVLIGERGRTIAKRLHVCICYVSLCIIGILVSSLL